MYLVFCGFYTINPVLRTSTYSPCQTRSPMVQWLNTQSPTTPSCSPAVTPPSPKPPPSPLSLPAAIVDKPLERYGVWRMMSKTGAAPRPDQPEQLFVFPTWKWMLRFFKPPGAHAWHWPPCLRRCLVQEQIHSLEKFALCESCLNLLSSSILFGASYPLMKPFILEELIIHEYKVLFFFFF